MGLFSAELQRKWRQRQNEKIANTYIHPLCRDEIWVNKLQVLHVIENIPETGKPKLSFKFSGTNHNKIEASVFRKNEALMINVRIFHYKQFDIVLYVILKLKKFEVHCLKGY